MSQSGPATITLRFDGSIRDRVGQNNLARNPDGQLDGTFTVTLNAGSGNRTVTHLLLVNSAGGAWNTEGGDGFWTLGAANGWDAVLLNGNNDAVNFPVADGGEFKIFAADFQNRMFLTRNCIHPVCDAFRRQHGDREFHDLGAAGSDGGGNDCKCIRRRSQWTIHGHTVG